MAESFRSTSTHRGPMSVAGVVWVEAFVLAILGAICWGIAPVFGKAGLRGVHPLDGLAARTVITVLLVGGWVIGSGRARNLFAIETRRWYFLAIEAFLATFAGDLVYYAALKKGDVGTTAVVLASSPVITVVLGRMLFGEAVPPLKMVGAGLIILGTALIGIFSLR